MANCTDCGRPIKWARLPTGEKIKLDASLSSSGPERYVIDADDGDPTAIAIADQRPEFAHPHHALLCGKPGQQ